MKEKQIYILLTDTGTVLTKLIKFYTRKPYNHASIAFDSDLEEVYSFGRKAVRNPFIGGFVKEDLDTVIFKDANCAIYSFTVSEHQIQQMYRYIQGIATQKELYRYNFIGLFGFMFNTPIKRKKAFFCSQFVATVLKEGNTIHFEKPPSLIAPNDLQKISKFQLVYEGKLSDYKNGLLDERMNTSLPYISIGM